MSTLLSKLFLCLTVCTFLSACTRGHIEYRDKNGGIKEACHTEYSWLPSVDKFAVEYVLVYCAKRAQQKGYTVINDKLLDIDITFPSPGVNQNWSHRLAKSEHAAGNLSDREYGYIIAFIDMNIDNTDE